ncbi:MAG: hypothetical protein M3O61_16310 [Gemmatimonadota bacterium]|nr:hypothetical protein [Gemmatimonadota bacterium]
MTRPEDLLLECLSAAHDITYSLLGLGGNPNDDELAGTIETGQFCSIVFVMLPLDARPLRNEGWCDHVALVTPLLHRSMEHVSGTTGFVASANLAITRDAIEKPLQLKEIIRQTVNARRGLGALGENRNGDGLLVHIHPEIDDRASSWSYFRNDFGN